MFEKIRKPGRRKNIASYLIFGLICLVFVFIGVPVQQASRLGAGAFRVNNTVISWPEFQNYLENLEAQATPNSDSSLEAERQERLKKEAVSALLNRELMSQGAEKIGLRPSLLEIRDNISRVPIFQEEGRFMHSRYRDFLRLRRFSTSYFETLIAKDIQARKFQELFSTALPYAFILTEKLSDLKSFKISIQYVDLPAGQFKPEELKIIEEWLKAGREDRLNSIFRDKALEWQKIKNLDLTRTALPGLILEEQLFSKMLVHLPAEGLVRDLIPGSKGQTFILKINKAVKEKTDKKSSPDFMEQLFSHIIFYSYLQWSSKQAKLKFHSSLESFAQP